MKRKKTKIKITLAQVYKDPKDNSRQNTKKLAESQTIHARNLIYNPNEIVKGELKKVAQRIKTFLSTPPMNDDLGQVIASRILSGGILAGKPYEEFTKTIDRLANDSGVTANDREVLIALLGDFGALAMDERVTGKQSEIKVALSNFCKYGSNNDPIGNDVLKEIRIIRGSLALGPTKVGGRSVIEKNPGPRSGILNTGEIANRKLRVPPGNEISPTKWPLMGIDEKRLKSTLEPWVGHMSGSPTEILFAWDLFIRENPLISYASLEAMPSILHAPERRARAFITAAFLISMGYHSALEVVEGTFAYLGDDLRHGGIIELDSDAGYSEKLKDGGATEIFELVFKEFTDPSKIYNETK